MATAQLCERPAELRWMSITYFCPNCWSESEKAASRCPSCGFDLSAYQLLSYESKLILGLRHPVKENRMMAIRILGDRRCCTAVPVFRSMLDGEEDIYIIHEIIQALLKIGTDECYYVLRRLENHRSRLVRALVVKARGRKPQAEQSDVIGRRA